MNYKRTMHIEYQGQTYIAAQDLERRISDAVQVVLEHSAMVDGLDRDAYMADRTITKGWLSDPSEDAVGVTRLTEQERINGLVDDLEVKYSEPFERHSKAVG